MFQTEEKRKKVIVTPEGEDEFQIRYICDEKVGLLTTRSNKSYLILDSIDFWYDIIRNKYPAKQKCSCKNDYFKLTFHYIPRIGTDDYRAVEIMSCCTVCGKQKMLSQIDIDYSPTSQLFENPITYCEQPKIKYKTYSLGGYWKEEAFRGLIEFLAQKGLKIYCWFWNQTEKRRYVKQMAVDELEKFLFIDKENYLSVFFSMESLDEMFENSISDEKGIYVDRDVWRKKELIVLNQPFLVAVPGAGKYYSVDFGSEYIEKGQIQTKSEAFCKLVQELLAYSCDNLK